MAEQEESAEDVVATLARRIAILDRDFEAMRLAYIADRHSIVRTLELLQPHRANGNGVSAPAPKSIGLRPPPPRPVSGKYGCIAKTVRRAALSIPGEFTRKDVLKRLTEINPAIAERVSSTLASHLWRLNTKEKAIKVIRKGSGHDQSVYAKV
jgi:hypothetical protein